MRYSNQGSAQVGRFYVGKCICSYVRVPSVANGKRQVVPDFLQSFVGEFLGTLVTTLATFGDFTGTGNSEESGEMSRIGI